MPSTFFDVDSVELGMVRQAFDDAFVFFLTTFDCAKTAFVAKNKKVKRIIFFITFLFFYLENEPKSRVLAQI